jgi:hypothetical protein
MKKYLLISLFIGAFSLVYAGKIEKAFEALKKYNYFEAKELFHKTLDKELVAASYGLSLIHSRNDNPFYHLDTAYLYIVKADSAFLKIDDKGKSSLLELGIDSMTIEQLRDTIEKRKFLQISSNPKIESLQAYINNYSEAAYLEKAIGLRNELAFEEAREINSSRSYQLFFVQYPNAVQATEARNRYEERLFAEQTSRGKEVDYQVFIQQYPESPYRNAAQDSIYMLYSKRKDRNAYYQFIKKNPDNPNVEKAWRNIYKLYTTNYSPEKIVEFRIDYPDYPFIEELMVDMKLAAKEFLPFRENGLWGFIDKEGEVMIAPQYDYVEAYSEGLAIAQKDGAVGFIDKAGKVVVPFMYEEAEAFKQGVAIVSRNGLYGMIDRTNKERVPIQYELVSPFSSGLALVANEKGYGYVDQAGHVVIPVELDYATDFERAYAVVEWKGKKGIINTLGKTVVPIEYDWIEPFDGNGICRAKKDNKYGLLDKNGSEVLPFIYDRIGTFYDSLAIIVQGDKYGYINRSGEEHIALKYDFVPEVLLWGNYVDGFAKYRLKDKLGVMDAEGESVFPAIFQDIGSYKEGEYIAVKKRGKWGYSNQNLKLVIPYDYDDAFTFNGAFAVCRLDSAWILIDREGKKALAEQFQSINLIGDSLFLVQQNGKYGLLGPRLEVLLPIEYEEIKAAPFKNLLSLRREASLSYYDLKGLKRIYNKGH